MSKEPAQAEEQAPSSRLLSKVVKFVTNPTTSWADLDRPKEPHPDEEEGIDEASRRALKQIIERKRRNDFVRNREFDMLRKVRHSQSKDASSESAQGSMSASQRMSHEAPIHRSAPAQHPVTPQPASLHARVDTLKKIDLIERQMARSWFQKKKEQEAAGRAAPASMPDGYASTQQVREAQTTAGLAPPPPQQAANDFPPQQAGNDFAAPPPQAAYDFPPQQAAQDFSVPQAAQPPAPQEASHAQAVYEAVQFFSPEPFASPDAQDAAPEAQAVSAQVNDTGPYIDTGRFSHAGPGIGNAPDAEDEQGNDAGFAPTLVLEQMVPSDAGLMPQAAAVEPLSEPERVLTAENLDPELEEAAIRFANGDIPGAEASLMGLLGEEGARNNHVETWLALFDLYRASGQQAKFDEAAIDFASCFGRSAPQWSANVNAEQPEQDEAPAELLPGQSARMHWVCPSTLGTQSVAALNATLARSPAPWHLDWHNLKTIEDAALPALLETLQRWGSAKGEYGMRGAGHLLDVLVEHSPTDNREINPQWWNARMALLRLMGEMDEFELVALNYCVTYEVSPPAWADPAARFVSLDDESAAAPPPEAAAPPPDSLHGVFQPSDFAPSRIFETQEGLIRGELSGIITDDVDKALHPLTLAIDRAPARAQTIDVNCRLLLRMDFSAAGGLLNWVTMQQALKRQVTLRQVNRLVGAFFGVIGIHEVARVVLRKD